MGKLGFRDNGSPYVYEEITGTSSAAIGLDLGDSGKLKFVVSLSPNATPGGTPLQMTIDPAANGNITFTPNGSGAVVVDNGNMQVTAGNITMPFTNAAGTEGLLLVNGNNFINTLAAGNVFVGTGSGNLTLNVFSALFNTAFGATTMQSLTTGSTNVTVGAQSLELLTTGNANIAMGTSALQNLVSGDQNIGIGSGAGLSYTTNESYNILIGNQGVIADANTIRIGTNGSGVGQQDTTYIAGIFGATPGVGSDMVVIDSTGLLATQAIPVGGIQTLNGDVGSATGTTVTIAGGSNISTSAAVATVTINLVSSPSVSGTVTAGSGLIATTGGVDVQAGRITFPSTSAGLADGAIFINSSPFMHAFGSHNTFLGTSAGNGTLTGADLTGIGFGALLSVTTAIRNTAVGSGALEQNDTGDANTGVGFQALFSANTAATQNTAVGFQALNALGASGSNNTALGYRALLSAATGSSNTAIGFNAGLNLDTTDSSNIMIGNAGTSGDNHKIIIGTQGSGAGQQNFTQIAGIYGVTPGGGGLNMATIDATGQLGSQALPSGSISITGDSGGALTGGAFTFTGGTTGLTFAGAGSTETLGGTLAIANGGTNATSMANTDGVVYYDGTRLVTTAVGTATHVLTSNGAGLAPTFQAVPSASISITGDSGGALTGSAFTFTGGSTGLTFAGAGSTETLGGTLAIGSGGTNATSFATTDGTVYYDGTRLVTTATGTVGQFLRSGGAGVAPAYATLPASSISITGDTGGALTGAAFTFTGGTTGLSFGGSGSTETLSGTLAIANGGTNATSMANTDGVVYYDGTRLVTTAVGTATQVLTSNGAGVAPTFQAVPSSGGLAWSEQTGTTQAMAVGHGYILNNAGTVTATLPATAALGDLMAIVGKGSGGWLVAQNSGQTIHFGSVNTTTGAGGSLASTNRYDSFEIVCITANTDFVVRSSIGNLTVV